MTATDAQLTALLAEADRARDYKQIALCDRALAGFESARVECARVIADAVAQDDGDE